MKRPVIGITGSTGKTSTKDILAALLAAHRRVLASPANHNTEIGLPLAVLAAQGDTEVLVLEMAMRGAGQIAELTEIAAPDVGVIVNVGPVHLELLGSLEAVAAAKAELIAGLRPGASLVVPAGEALLAPYLREDLRTLTFGAGGDVTIEQVRRTLRPSFAQAHNLADDGDSGGSRDFEPTHARRCVSRGERAVLPAIRGSRSLGAPAEPRPGDGD